MTRSVFSYWLNDFGLRVLGFIQIFFVFPRIQEFFGADVFVSFIGAISFATIVGRVGTIGLQDALFRYLPRYGRNVMAPTYTTSTALIVLATVVATAVNINEWGWYAAIFFCAMCLNLHFSGAYKQDGDFARFRLMTLAQYAGPLLLVVCIELMPKALLTSGREELFLGSSVFIVISIAAMGRDIAQRFTANGVFFRRNLLFATYTIPVVFFGLYVEQASRIMAIYFFTSDEAANYILHLNLLGALVLYPISMLNITIQFYFGRKLRVHSERPKIAPLLKIYILAITAWVLILTSTLHFVGRDLWAVYSGTKFSYFLAVFLAVKFAIIGVFGVLADYLLYLDKRKTAKCIGLVAGVGLIVMAVSFRYGSGSPVLYITPTIVFLMIGFGWFHWKFRRDIG